MTSMELLHISRLKTKTNIHKITLPVGSNYLFSNFVAIQLLNHTGNVTNQ